MVNDSQVMSFNPHGYAKDLKHLYKVKFTDQNTSIIVSLDETKLLKAFFTQSKLFEKAGAVTMLVLEVGFTKGGPEAIAESVYSLMGS